MASKGSNVIRDLLVRLGVVIAPGTKKDLDDLDKKIEDTKKAFEDLAAGALKLGAALAAGVLAAATAAGVLAVQTGEQAMQIERQARALNLTRKEYQEIQYVFESFGADAGEIADVFQQINDKAVDAQQGSTSVVAEWKLLGISVSQLKGKRPHEIFELIADASANATDKQKAMAGVSKLLGEDSAKKLAPALALGSKEIRRMRGDAEDLGLVMNDTALAAAKETAVQWRRLTSIAKGLRNELGVALAPVVTEVFRGINEWVKANRALLSQQITAWVERLHAGIHALLAAVRLIGGWDVVFVNVAQGVGILLLLANLSKILDILTAMRLAFGFLKGAAAASGITIGAAFLPATIVLSALAAIVAILALAAEDVWVHFTGGNSALGVWLDTIEAAIPAFGAVREFFWALVQLLAGGATNLSVLVGGFVRGLAPALQLISAIINPLIAKFEDLLGLWRKLNDAISSPIRAATAWMEGTTYVAENNSRMMAGAIQHATAEKIQPGVDEARFRIGAATNSWTANQTMTFSGTASQGDFERALESSNRKAAVSVQGGPR